VKIRLYTPQNPLLTKYIECIYILTQNSEENSAKYLTFPTLFTIVSISEKSRSVVKGNDLTIEHDPDGDIETSLVGNFNQPVFVQYQGAINEITIYFKPLGLNAFLVNDLINYRTDSFGDFNPFDDYKSRMAAILALDSDEEKLRSLELYWLSKLKGFEHPILEKIINRMMSGDDRSLSMTELSKISEVSRSTMNKLFQKHLCRTPSQFKKIIRFREVLKGYLAANPEARLTNITYNLNYFDQSHMIKDFKALTNFSPRKFFSKITKFEDGQIIWLFI
jgi:AraC-like DNA-binding protein